jgi:undecaprenyl-diphosphatase
MRALLVRIVIAGAMVLALCVALSLIAREFGARVVALDQRVAETSHDAVSGADVVRALAHAASAFGSPVVLTMIVIVAAVRWIRRRRWLVASTILIAAAGGASRLGLGVHYLSDVVSGFAFGLAWTIPLVTAPFRRAGARAHRRLR